MKHFFNKFLCMHPRLVLCFFFAMSGNPLVACESFGNSLNAKTTELCVSKGSDLVLNQGEDVHNDLDALDDCEKKLLLDGYARENFNEDGLPFFLKKDLALVMNYLCKMNEEPRISMKVIYGKEKYITVKIEDTNCLIDPKEMAFYNSPKELLLCGFLSRKNRVFIQYIPKDILQTLILFIHDDTIPNRIKESKRIEKMLKRYIKKANENITGQIACRKEKRTDYKRYLQSVGFCCCCSVVSIAVTGTSLIMHERDDTDKFAWHIAFVIFLQASMYSILFLGLILYYKEGMCILCNSRERICCLPCK